MKAKSKSSQDFHKFYFDLHIKNKKNLLVLIKLNPRDIKVPTEETPF